MRFNRPNLLQKLLAGFFVLLFVATPVLISGPREVEARPVTVIGGPGSIADISSAAFNAIISGNTSSLFWKEYILDPLLWSIAKMIISMIIRSIIAWVNSGFQGAPMFITDPGAFLRDIADQVAGEMIYGSPLGFLCRPINIRISLELHYRQSRNFQNGAVCRLSGVINNVQSFLNGNFLSGGWPGFLALSLNPTSNNFGALFTAEIELTRRIAGSQQEVREKLQWGKGFFSKEECTTGADGKKTCKIVTPGDTIAQATTFQITAGQVTLITADEINELIAALMQQLIMQVMQGLGGLFGTSQPGGGAYSGGFFDGTGSTTGSTGSTTSAFCAGLSYLDQMVSPLCSGQTSTTGNGDTTLAALSAGIESERDYQGTQERIIAAADLVIASANAQGLSCGNNASIASQAASVRDQALARIDASNVKIDEVAALQNAYYAASTTEQSLAILTQLATYAQPGELHNSTSVWQADQDATDQVTGLQSLGAGVASCSTAGTGGTQDNAGGP